ncbi:YopX family protein [Patescibacteria group bacterium]|nr:YopX family protein [Patescibacteria group bacterium]
MIMRDIEFRGISIAYDSFIYGYYYENNDKSFIVTKKGNHIQVHKNSVGQYTGRKDTNNVKIYENDIVKFNKQATSI